MNEARTLDAPAHAFLILIFRFSLQSFLLPLATVSSISIQHEPRVSLISSPTSQKCNRSAIILIQHLACAQLVILPVFNQPEASQCSNWTSEYTAAHTLRKTEGHPRGSSRQDKGGRDRDWEIGGETFAGPAPGSRTLHKEPSPTIACRPTARHAHFEFNLIGPYGPYAASHVHRCQMCNRVMAAMNMRESVNTVASRT